MDAKGKGAFEISEDKAVRRGRPKGLAKLRTYATGKEILVLGPSSAGKSKFAEYLQLGRLHPEGEREMTYGITKSPTFVLTLAADPDASRSGRSGLVLNVRRTVDTPGQTGPVQHASLVGERKPHAIVIMLDGSKSVSATVHWLSLFCNRLDTILRRGRHAHKKLREIAVVLNKRDKIDRDQCDELTAGVREVLQRHLSVVLGADRVGAIPIFECISIQTPQGTALIDTVLTHLAQQLVG